MKWFLTLLVCFVFLAVCGAARAESRDISTTMDFQSVYCLTLYRQMTETMPGQIDQASDESRRAALRVVLAELRNQIGFLRNYLFIRGLPDSESRARFRDLDGPELLAQADSIAVRGEGRNAAYPQCMNDCAHRYDRDVISAQQCMDGCDAYMSAPTRRAMSCRKLAGELPF